MTTDERRIRLIRQDNNIVSVEVGDDVSAEEIIAFLALEEPRLAASLRRTVERVRRANVPGFSDQSFFRQQEGL